MKTVFIILAILLLSFSSRLNAQTNVSGGIYSNTTWTLANSPYIVVDTVAVFPNVTLTIEPGVTVKFADYKRLEIRQGTLVAEGTSSDSITFTSNSGFPTPGIWPGVFMNGNLPSTFNFCEFRYADKGVELSELGQTDTTFIKNSNFRNNITGFYSGYVAPYSIYNSIFRNNTNGIISYSGNGALINNCIVTINTVGIVAGQYSLVENCVIDSNIRGVVMPWKPNVIKNCQINYNNIGLIDTTVSGYYYYNEITTSTVEYNNIGIKLGASYDHIYCNKICNNTTLDLQYSVNFGGNINMPNNYWCTTDSTVIASHIYDGYDNINLGLVNFMPMDTSQCYLTGCNLGLSATVTNATCDTCHDGAATVQVSNGIPPYIYTWYTIPIQTTQTATDLEPGSYTVCVTDANGCTICSNPIFIDSTNCTGYSIATQAANTSCSTCNDGSGWVNVTGGTPPYSYTWYTFPIQTSDTATNLLQGTYAVCVTDLYGCSACDSATVSTGNCSAYFALYPDTVPHQYSAVNMASGVSPLIYLWSWGDGTFDSTAFPSHTYAAAGFYTICLTIHDSVGCVANYCNSYYLLKMSDAEAENTIVTVNVVAGIPTVIQITDVLQSWSVFPNPASGNALINYSLSIPATISIDLYDVLGNRLWQVVKDDQQAGEHNSAFDTRNLSNGVYVLQIRAGDQIASQKIVLLR
ncbi:MAG TPA: T9SS type A sorting domain-containing protein [Chitinophagales bacterium]|nr:T9SS type A sorting domain-containing protein [Chitinophagales bacterium]